MAHDVFISYSARDKPAADAVCAKLESSGIRCWIAPRDITPGMSWGGAIIGAIDGARVMLLIFSSKADASQQIRREIERAVFKEMIVIPIRIEDVQPTGDFAYFLGTPHWLDAISPPFEQHLKRIAETAKFWLDRGVGNAGSDGIYTPTTSSSGFAEQRPLLPPPVSPKTKTTRSPIVKAAIAMLLGLTVFLGVRHYSFPVEEAKPDGEQRNSPLRCDQESQLRSLIGPNPVTLDFRNATNNLRKVYWLDYNGKRNLYQELAPGTSYQVETYPTHPWVITDENDRCIAVFLATPSRSLAVIDR
jgi:hypothetical protein